VAELDDAGAAEYHFYEAGTSAPGLALAAAEAALPRRVAVYYLGTLGLVFEPLATTLETLATGCRTTRWWRLIRIAGPR
jgi:hypothetical protein